MDIEAATAMDAADTVTARADMQVDVRAMVVALLVVMPVA
jgi:hypothetical protein